MKHGPTRRGVLAGAAGLIALPCAARAMEPGIGRLAFDEASGVTAEQMAVF